MHLINVDGNRYIIKQYIPMENIQSLDDDITQMVKSFLGADTIIEQKSQNVYIFCERIKEANIIEETEHNQLTHVGQ